MSSVAQILIRNEKPLALCVYSPNALLVVEVVVPKRSFRTYPKVPNSPVEGRFQH